MLRIFILAVSLLFTGPLQAATLIVANKAEATVSLVDLGSGKVVSTLPVGIGPHEVAVSPDGRQALIANYGTREKEGSTLTLIDVPGAKVLKTIDLGGYMRPHGMVFLDARRALVTSEAAKTLIEVDVVDGKVLRGVGTGQEVSHMVAVTPDHSRAFVANIGSGTMTAIDLKAGKPLGNVQTGAGTEGIDVSPDGRQVWVTSREANTVVAVDTQTLEVLATIPVESFPIRVKIVPDGRRALVSCAKSGDLAVLEVAERKLERRVPVPVPAVADKEKRLMTQFGDSSVPIGIVVTPDGKRAFVAHANGDTISIVDLAEWKRVGSLTAGKEPDGMGYSQVDVFTREGSSGSPAR
ncbi:MAG TPA: cytochrome D1 domain-containing protein [Thermoanaerobaculia bacterium]|jgi:YVTN family beta-propeller protein|nr:cytochrome D1 domain-containing protein [Thermoanaerobaculia bacterium]